VKTNLLKQIATGAVLLSLGTIAQASLSTSYQFNGKGNWSIDALGTLGTSYSLSAMIPTGSTVEKAFLYQTTQGNTTALDLTFGGTLISGSSWTNLGTTTAHSLTAFRADVTSQVAGVAGGGSGSPFTFGILESDSFHQEGSSLVVVYSDPGESERTIALLDGFTDPAGDSTFINLVNPISAADLSNPSFEAQMSLGIGFSAQGTGQYSTVDINGTRLSTSAGGQDDGAYSNGALISVGDTFNDNFLTNPTSAFATPSNTFTDDEAYNLKPLLTAGTSLITIDTENPSFDDNIFFAGINITAEATVTGNPVPTPATLPLMAFGALMLGLYRRKNK